MALQHLRSSTADKRPTPGSMSDGQLAMNTNLASPGLFFKDSNGDLVKVGPVHVGTTAPNVSPAGQSGNSKGEQWLDTSSSRYVFKIWDGTAWRSEAGEFVDVSGDVMTGALGIIAGTAGAPGLYVSGDTNTGIYSPGADQLALATNGTGRLFVDSSGNIGAYTSNPTAILQSSLSGSSSGLVISSSVPTIVLDDSVGTTGLSYWGHLNTDTYFYNKASGNLILGTNNLERLRITSAGLVGIGTSSPATLLEVKSTTTNSARLRVTGTGTTAGNFRGYEFSNGSVFKGGLLQDESTDLISIFTPVGGQSVNITSAGAVGVGTTSPSVKLEVNGDIFASGGDIYTGPNKMLSSDSIIRPLIFGIGASEKAQIDSSGRLLVGTSSTSATLTALLQGNSGGATSNAGLMLARGEAPAVDGTVLGALDYAASNHVIASRILCKRDGGTWTPGTSQPTRLEFSTTADGASSPTERMRISNDGSIYFGSAGAVNPYMAFAPDSAGGSFVKDTNSTNSRTHFTFKISGTTVGSITTSGSATAYNTSSDYRLKENVVPLTGAANRVNQLQVHRFNFIADPDKTVDGFIAHEAQAVVPECVTGTKDEVDADGNPIYQGIDQSKLVPLLTAALQEALAEIESLKDRLTAAGI